MALLVVFRESDRFDLAYTYLAVVFIGASKLLVWVRVEFVDDRQESCCAVLTTTRHIILF